MDTNLYQRAVTIVRRYFQNAVNDANEHYTEETRNALLKFGILMCNDYRLHVMFSPEQARKLWAEEIRASDTITDFVLCLKTRLCVELSKDDLSALTQSIVNAFCIDPPTRELSLIDDTLYERAPQQAFLIDLLDNNLWLVPLYLMSTLTIGELLGGEV